MAKQDEYTRITLRIPRDLHERLSEVAEDTSKSMNAEIIARLEESFKVVVRRPADPAINIVEMARDQKMAFLASVERSLGMANSTADLVMLHALRDATKSELEVIEAQIAG